MSEVPENPDKPHDSSGQAGAWNARREQLAKLLFENFTKLQGIARRKLTVKTKSVFDSHDVVSSAIRRLDKLASEGRLEAISDEEVVRLASAVVQNQAVSRTRTMERFSTLVAEDGPYAQAIHQRLKACADDEGATMLCYRIALSIGDAESRQLFLLRWKGVNSTLIGQMMGITSESVRYRWMTLRKTLEEKISSGAFDERI